MSTDQLPDHIVYSQPVIEFVTVTAETCLFLENASEMTKTEFVRKTIKFLPLLYLKASLLEIPEPVFEDGAERFVTEEDYLYVKEQIEQLLGADDSYLETFHPDMSISDTPIAAFISENLADIYQELKDFAANYQLADMDVMNDALVVCLQAFGEHWGQKLLNSLRALHAIRFSDAFGAEEEEEPAEKSSGVNRNAFMNFLQDDDDDELENLL